MVWLGSVGRECDFEYVGFLGEIGLGEIVIFVEKFCIMCFCVCIGEVVVYVEVGGMVVFVVVFVGV